MPEPLVSFEDWERRAREVLDRDRFAYVSSGAGEGDSIRENIDSFKRWRLVPRVLGPSKASISTTILGSAAASPILLAPVRAHNYLHHDGEIGTARAAVSTGVPMVMSNYASATIEEIGKTMGSVTHLFQLYPCTDPELVESFLRRVEGSGFLGVVLTVDTSAYPVQYYGPRSSEYDSHGLEVYFSDPVFRSRLKEPPEKDRKSALELLRKVRASSFTWEDVQKIRSNTKLPIVLKGVLSPTDAEQAVSEGVSGIVVSNHGGRSLDGSIAPLDAFPGIAKVVGDKTELFLDGGIRSGPDVVKALAMGAKGVLIGKAYLYPLAVAGETGVATVLKRLNLEIESTLISCGCATVAGLSPSHLARVP